MQQHTIPQNFSRAMCKFLAKALDLQSCKDVKGRNVLVGENSEKYCVTVSTKGDFSTRNFWDDCDYWLFYNADNANLYLLPTPDNLKSLPRTRAPKDKKSPGSYRVRFDGAAHEAKDYVVCSFAAGDAPGFTHANPYLANLAMHTIASLVDDDAYACTFQTVGQYRTALRNRIREMQKQLIESKVEF